MISRFRTKGRVKECVLALALILVGWADLEAQVLPPANPVAAPVEEEGITTWARLILEQGPTEDGALGKPEADGLEKLRALYFLSVVEKDWLGPAEDLLSELQARSTSSAETGRIVKGYRGALDIVRAKHARWPPKKLKHLRQGSAILDSLVTYDPKDLEIRYLRYASYRFLPVFLERPEAVEADQEALVTGLPSQPEAFSPWMYRGVLEFVLSHASLSPTQRRQLENLRLG